MSHEIPSYYRYVSNINIDDAGSGYPSGSNPVVTITGGGGTGAAAVAEVLPGTDKIASVTITNIGSGYTSTPIVTVEGNGQLSAEVSFASATPSSVTRTASPNIKWTVPEFIRNDYSGATSFLGFIEKYYSHLDEPGNAIHELLNKRYFDIDDAEGDILDAWSRELAYNFPRTTELDRLTLFKYLKSIYESKGSKRSIEAFFKIVYDEDVEVTFPSQFVLRASDGQWVEERSVRAFAGYQDYEVLNIEGTLVDIVYYETTGSVTIAKRVQTSVPKVLKISYTSPQKYEIVLDVPKGTVIPGPGAQASATPVIVGGVITDFTISNAGYQYTAAPTIQIFDINASPGSGFEGRAVVENGQVTDIVISDGGSGYNDGDTSIVFNTDSVRTIIVDRGATAEEENVRAYLDRTLDTITSGTYVGSDAGFKVGDTFIISETGDDGRGYALDYFAQDYVFIGGGNDAIIRVVAVDANNVPTAWEIVNPGNGFINSVTTITITSDTGEDLDVVITTNYLYESPGKYKDDRGFLSDVNRLQDNDKWQSYSYIIQSNNPKSQWEDSFKESAHIAGMEVFGDIVVQSELNYGPNISIVSIPYGLVLFVVDTINIDDSTIVFAVDKVLADTATTSDSTAIATAIALADATSGATDNDFDVAMGLSKTDTVTTSDADISFVTSYAYSDSATVAEAPVFDVSRPLTDSATASESASINTSIVKSDSATAIDLLGGFVFGKGLLDTVTTSDVLITFDVSILLTDSADASESISFQPELNISDSTGAFENINRFDIDKPFTDSANATESISLHPNKVRGDSVTTSEAIDDFFVGKALFDTGTATDEINSFDVDYTLADSAASSDSEVFDFSKSLTDTASPSESLVVSGFERPLTDSATASESASINTGITLTDSTTNAESVVKAISSNPTNSVSTSDVGLINVQDFAGDFFAEDYVGTNYIL